MLNREKIQDSSLSHSNLNQGKVIIFSAPSGSGKTTIVTHLIENNRKLDFSISACTRPKRSHEVDGQDYYFLNPDEFKEKIAQEEFVEWEEVYTNTFYGTLKSEIHRIWSDGKHVIFDVDVKGGLNLKKYYGDLALAIFIAPPSLEVLETRLRMRNTDSEESIQERLAKAKEEMTFQDSFDTIVINEDLSEALDQIQILVKQFTEP